MTLPVNEPAPASAPLVEPPPGRHSELEAPLPSKRMLVNLGPSHPAMHGVTRAVVELEGEVIRSMKLDIGFLHRGFEKSCEQVTWGQCFPYTDRLNYVSSIMNNVGFALAVEKLCRLEVPERARYLRVVTSELHRICDHLTLVAAMGLELGAMTVFLYAIEARDLIWDRLAELCGARLTSNYARIGGVSRDVPEGWVEKTVATLDRTVELREEIDGLLTRNRIFVDRTRNTGKISREEAIELGFTGPCLRASGEPYDVRKAFPYLVYDRLDFDVPVGSTGDNFDRYAVRLEEMAQSMRILEQALTKIPGGPVIVDDPRVALPSKRETYNTIEAMIAHFKLIMDGLHVPPGEIYSFTEGGNGELGFYIVADGSGRPWKCRVRPPCVANLAVLTKVLPGLFIADVVPTFGMINMIGGECDR